ncbi:MAG: ATP-dependent zinc metalloprotease FtsH, partial [Planctomycetota bacterium]
MIRSTHYANKGDELPSANGAAASQNQDANTTPSQDGGDSKDAIQKTQLLESIAISVPISSSDDGFVQLAAPQDIRVGLKSIRGTVWIRKLSKEGTAKSSSFQQVDFETYWNRINQDEDTALMAALQQSNVIWWNADKSRFWQDNVFTILMMVILVGMMIFIVRKMTGAGSPMAFSRSRGKLYGQEELAILFDDVAGIDEAVDEVSEIVDFLKNAEKYQALGGRIPKGVLLVGPPGTGKTLLAKAIAGEAGVPFFSLSGSDFVEMYVGVGAARVRDMFSQAVDRAPCIIFIDELDALGKSRSGSVVGGHDEREQTLNALLVEMDGFDSNSGVIVIAATNRPETLDAALMRPGRFDRQVLVDRPDLSGREEILRVHVKNVKLDDAVQLIDIAQMTSGFAGADLANLVNEAALLAARAGKKSVTHHEFDEAVERVTAGLEKKSRVMSEDEKIRVAYHESGHAIVAMALPNTDPVHKVSIIPRGIGALGYDLQRPEG